MLEILVCLTDNENDCLLKWRSFYIYSIIQW